ncbi:hypothetical protein [Shinella zoogloeoides]|uniref:hypothetical protein n=1 Tax=Shinella zoogloeoides TaxID=352475 RepID=UPI00299EED3B|nr:hypothetical protein [Shinella zoogloeoides]WPE19932.1 hypothetical protein ShzoTeo12_11100 [Shinella zoogloeoides]
MGIPRTLLKAALSFLKGDAGGPEFFAGEKLVADRPVILPPVPEYPAWMHQPGQDETFDARFLHPTTISSHRRVNRVSAMVIIGALIAMPLINALMG